MLRLISRVQAPLSSAPSSSAIPPYVRSLPPRASEWVSAVPRGGFGRHQGWLRRSGNVPTLVAMTSEDAITALELFTHEKPPRSLKKRDELAEETEPELEALVEWADELNDKALALREAFEEWKTAERADLADFWETIRADAMEMKDLLRNS